MTESPPKPARRLSWGARALTALAVLAVVLLTVSVTVSAWRLLWPRPAAPTYVCVYVVEDGVTAVSGAEPCPRP